MNDERAWWPGLPELVSELDGCSTDAVRDLLAAGQVRLSGPGSGSVLNNDGTPVEIVVAVDSRARRVRLLMDPAHWERDPLRRSRLARGVCRDVAAGLARDVRSAFDRALDEAMPDESASRRWLPSGCLWLGTGPARPGLAVYVSARWGDRAQRWARVFRWLDGLGLPAQPWRDAVSTHGDPASVSLAAGDELRARVYFRLRARTKLSDLGLEGLDDPALHHFLAAVIGDRAMHRSGLLISVSAVVGGAPALGYKVDVCAHCVPRESAEWAALTERLAVAFQLPSPGLDRALLGGRAEMAFIGFGFPAGGSYQLNCYLKAPSLLPSTSDA